MKKWRIEAAQHNEDAGKKHQGRKHKTVVLAFPKFQMMSNLAKGLFLRAGLPVGVVTP